MDIDKEQNSWGEETVCMWSQIILWKIKSWPIYWVDDNMGTEKWMSVAQYWSSVSPRDGWYFSSPAACGDIC